MLTVRMLGVVALAGLALVVWGASLAGRDGRRGALGSRHRRSGSRSGMSAAGDDPRHAAGRVSVVATIGYVAFLAGPPLIGFLGEQVGTLRALTVTGGLVALGLLVSGVAPSASGRGGGRPRREPRRRGLTRAPRRRRSSSRPSPRSRPRTPRRP